jgi:hypothetical protein
MYSPKIKEDLIPIIYRKSKLINMSMTKFVDDLLRSQLTENVSDEIIYRCCSCCQPIEIVDGVTGYCDHCESIVFVEKI